MHYKDFLSVYGTQTSEKFRPSKAGQSEADNLPQAFSIIIVFESLLNVIFVEKFDVFIV